MDISCDIIRDLLPLYAEDLVSDDSRKLVDEHLCTCDPCSRQLGILKKTAQMPIEVDIGALKHLGNTIRRRRILAAVAAVFTVLTVLVMAVGWLNVTIYLEPEDAVLAVEAQEDGSLRFLVPAYVMGHSSFGWVQEGYENMCYAHTWNTTRLDYLKNLWNHWRGIPTVENIYVSENVSHPEKIWREMQKTTPDAKQTIRMEDCHHWLLDAYTGMLAGKLWGKGDSADSDPNPRDLSGVLRTNFWCGCLIGIVFAACTRIPMKSWLKELAGRFAILGGSVALSQLILTGGKFISVYVSNEPYRTLRWVYTVAAFLALTLLFWRQLHRLNKQDRGM